MGSKVCDDIPTVSLLGVRVHALRLAELIEYAVETAVLGEKALITYVNAHALNLAYEVPSLRDVFNRAEIVFCDGFGAVLGAYLVGKRIPERMTPPDWVWKLAEAGQPRNLSFYLLGARPGVAERCAQLLLQRVPGLRIVGVQHGYFDKTYASAENELVIERINAVTPNILLVGLGMPLQERWLMENRDRLEVNVALTVGALFDYLSGEVPRVPRWMTDHGLEWLGRLIIEPRRLWRRYLIGNPLFVWRVLKQRLGLLRFD